MMKIQKMATPPALLAAVLAAAGAAAQPAGPGIYDLNRIDLLESSALRTRLADFERECGSPIAGSALRSRKVFLSGDNPHMGGGSELYLFYPGARLFGRSLYRLQALSGEGDLYWASVLLQNRAQFDAFARAFGRNARWSRGASGPDESSRWFPDAAILAAKDGRVVEEFRSPDGGRTVALYEAVEEEGSSWMAMIGCNQAGVD